MSNRGGPQTHNAEWKKALCQIIIAYIMIFTWYSKMGKTNGKTSQYLLFLEGWSGVDWKNVMGQLSGMILLLFSHSVMSKPLQPHRLQHARLPCPSLTPRFFSDSCQLSQWYCLTISSTATPCSAFNLCQHQGLFHWVRSLYQVAKVLEFQLQHRFFQWIFRVDIL